MPFVAFLAIAIQCLVIQTHIHSASLEAARGGVSITAQAMGGVGSEGALPSGKLDPASDSTNCPLCAEALLGGHFVSPTAVVFVAPDHQAIAFAEFAARIAKTPSHNWQGRAPPRI